MFLFLSKLLPQFIYPIGLACLLLIGALITLWKRPRLSAVLILLALLALLIPSNSWIAAQTVRSLEWQNLPAANLPTADAIVVLGGATRPQKYPRPWVDVADEGDRILHGARLYLQGKAPLLILSGGRIDWQNNAASESADMAQIAIALGVPASAILQDPTSLNTYENAVNVKQILQARNINRVLLVTSAMHMPRSIAIFKKQGIEAVPAPTDFLISQEQLQSPKTPQEVVLNLLPDSQNLNQFTRAMKEYIGLVVYRLKGWL
ncbi:MAG: YdcF family protein [Elainellaceae cyanobacterium]